MKPELLAPAGDFDSLKAAINNGADAVYLGLDGFNARATAQNFNKETIFDAVRLAHLYGVKVYIALNTLVSNSEIPMLLDSAAAAVDAKADAFIVQDLGVAAILTRCFTNICLHASTQMGIHNLYGAQTAQRLGIKRVVLSRETKLEDIRQIKAQTELELEFFVQGALCVGFSGQCYISALENDKSGNRGRCLQLCRLPYAASFDGKNIAQGHLLSTADLCLIDNLKLLADSGISAFKIEGRLRRAGYVAEAVACYRKAIDNGFPSGNTDSVARLKKVFFRGEYITQAYLNEGVSDGIINKTDANHIGLPIGEVIKSAPFKDIYEIELSTKHRLAAGDGLKFFDNGTQIGSIGVGNVVQTSGGTYKVYGKVKPKAGTTVNLILDKAAEDTALARAKKLPIDVQIIAKKGEPLRLTASFNGITVSQESDYIIPAAETRPTSPTELASLVSRVGDSVFCINGTTTEAQNIFIPKSVANETRRNLISKLENAIIDANQKHIIAAKDTTQISAVKQQAAAYHANSAEILPIYQSETSGGGLLQEDKISIIYPADYTAKQTGGLVQQAQKQGYRPCLRLPTLANSHDIQIIEGLLADCPQIKTLFINNPYGFAFADKGYEIIAGWGINIYNNFALDAAAALGAAKAVQSIELKDNLAQNGSLYRFAGKGLPIMTLAHCPYKTVYGGSCTQCKYSGNLKYNRGKKSYNIVRHRASQCTFELIAD